MNASRSAMDARSDRRYLALVAVALGIVSIVVYFPALNTFFVSDDLSLVSFVQSGGPFGVWTAHQKFFRPVISLSLFLDYSIWGLTPPGYKLTNVLLHTLNSALVVLSIRLLASRAAFERRVLLAGSAVGGIIFALLPAHTEAVSWISGRTDVICAVFVLSSWCAFLLYDRERKARYLTISAISFALALLSKEAAITLPVIMGLTVICWRALKLPTARLVIALLVNSVILLVYLPIRLMAVGGIGGYGADVHLNIELLRWLPWAPIFLGRAVWPCCWPAHSLPEAWSLAERIAVMRWFYLVVGASFAAAMTGFALWQARKRYLSGWIAFLLLTSSVVAQLPSVTIGLQVETRIGERLIYLPSVFVSSLIAVVAMTAARAPALRIGLALLIGIYATSLWQANQWWRVSGDIAQQIVRSMRLIDVSTPVSVILPDHIQGAFIFRNGIQSAADLYGIGGRWNTLALVALDAETDQFEIQEEAGGAYTITALNPKSAIIPLGSVAPSAASTAQVTVSPDSRSALVVPPTGARLAYYSEGRLHLVPRPQHPR